MSPWLIGHRVTACARKTVCSTGLQLLANSSAEMMESLVVVISRISPLEVEAMLSVSLSADERASSSES